MKSRKIDHFFKRKVCESEQGITSTSESIKVPRIEEVITSTPQPVDVSIDIVRWLTLQACAFRGHDETSVSKNQGNFLELLKLLASYNDEVAKVVLNNAPKNGKYTSHQIQKELLAILSSRVKKHIREEIGDSKFCIIVDEARDESQKEQMALVLRFVDKAGLIQERFFDMRCVTSTTSLSLKEAVCDILSRHNLDVSNLRGQGYDGASNMRGEWNGLQALFMKDCPYAYYIHCFAHRLQLALVPASREVKPIHKFSEKLTFVVNVVCSSPKRLDDLQAAQLKEIEHLLEIQEGLVTIERVGCYFLIDRLLCLIMTLPVSTATTERSFSAMKIIKTRLRNKMGSGFLNDSMTVYIEREISASIDSELVIGDFKLVGSRQDLF